MPRPRQPRAQTREQWLQLTENARRAARFKFAAERMDKIASGDPPFTAEQLAELARRLTAGTAA
jgi:hypothetical protein